MTSPPVVSVVMPVYNAGRFVAEAVESILGQTFGDFEFLILDDGSTDGSRAIVEGYARRDTRIRLVGRPNRGLVPTLNELLGMARGEFVARMDADDVSLPDRFERQVAFLRARPETVVVGGAQDHIDEGGRLLHNCLCPEDDDEIQAEALEGRCRINHPSVLMRRADVLAVGGYREEMKQLEDLDLWLRLGERGKLANLCEVVIKYRYHVQSKSERYQVEQATFARKASDDACDRRGIPRRYVPEGHWRPVDRSSRHDNHVGYGWIGFQRGDRSMALHYGLKAVRLMPWRADGWRLLACALLKRPRPGGATP